MAKTLIASCAEWRSRIEFSFWHSKFVHSADKLAEMRTKFHVIQAKLIMSVWGFTVHCALLPLPHSAPACSSAPPGNWQLQTLCSTSAIEILKLSRNFAAVFTIEDSTYLLASGFKTFLVTIPCLPSNFPFA